MSLIDESAFIKRVSVVLMKHKIVSFKDMLVEVFCQVVASLGCLGRENLH